MADLPTLPSGIRCRAYLDDRLRQVMPQWIGCQRVIYNAKVAEDRERTAAWHAARQQGLEPPSTRPDQAYSHLKREDQPWLSEVPAEVLRNGVYRFHTAKTRQLKGLAKAPRKRKRFNFDSVLLTRELFRFLPVRDAQGKLLRHDIQIGTKAHPVGVMRFTAPANYELPSMIVVRRESSGQWFVSFSFEKELPQELRTPQELAYELNNRTDAELQELVAGLDRNVADNCVATSTGESFAFSPVQLERLRKKEKYTRKCQRRMARQVKGSANREKTKRRIAKNKAYGKNVRHDFAHQTSHALVKSPQEMFVLEDLNITGMTKAPAPKQDAKGRYLPNGASRKAGLSGSILRSAWGLTEQCLLYKAAAANKLVVSVPAQYSSQECSRCGHTSPDNRPTRARFVCTACGYAEHADGNAARVLKRRGIALLRSGALEKKPPAPKRTRFRRKSTLGADGPRMPVEPLSDAGAAQLGTLGAVGAEAGTSRKRQRFSGNPHYNA